MKKSMKAMKAMKAKKSGMKGMKKKAMKKSVIAKGKRAKSSVFRGTKVKTSGGLKKNKAGHVVSRKRSARGLAIYLKNKKMQKWTACFIKARKALGIKGFCPCGGKTAKGKALLAKTRSFYRA